ncbi:hypothetical protein AAVH_21040, partial [Aphelenchoides avenae]
QFITTLFFIALNYFSVSKTVPASIANVVGLSLPYAGDLLSLSGSVCLLLT